MVLSVQTADGEDTELKESYIEVSPTPVAPTAAFSADSTIGIVPLNVDFIDLSVDGNSPITSRLWDFGDGTTSTEQNPTHTYTTVGTYTVSLTVTNAVGSDTDSIPSYITVAPVPVAPTAAFSGTPTSGSAPLEVTFMDESTAGTSPITARLWDFGDTTTSSETNPIHTYAGPGSYTVTLSVLTDDGEDTEIKEFYIQVAAPSIDP